MKDNAEVADGQPTATPVSKALRSGMIWNFVNFAGSQIAGLVIFLVLASRLPPEIFGVIALATVVADIVANEGRYAGMDAVLQANAYDADSLDGSFWAFMGICLVVAIGLWVSTPYVASAYDAPLLVQFVPIFALMLLATPWLSVMDALIMRNLGFKQLTQRNILSTLVGGAAGIACVFSPWMIWSLAVQRLVSLLVAFIFEYHFTRWSPRFNLPRAPMQDFLGRFVPLWLISALNLALSRIATVVFGIRYDTTTLGLLRAANRLGESVQGPLVSPLMGLWFPLMSKVRGDAAKEREVYLSILRTAAFMALPVFTGLLVVTEDLVRVLLPDTYAGATGMMRAVALISLMIPISWFNPIAMSSLGMNRASLTYTIGNVIVSTAALLAFPNVSPEVAILVISAPALFFGIGGQIFLNARLKISNRRHFGGLLPAAAASLVMGVATWTLNGLLTPWDPLVRMIAVATVGVIVYAAYLLLFHRSWTVDRVQLLRGRAASDV